MSSQPASKSAFRIDVFTIFPKLVDDFCSESLLGRARDEALIDLRCHDLRDYGDESRRVDDALYGGGAGMLFRPELCGRYEGVDHRVVEHLVDAEISSGDVVLAGGEVAACLVIEATTRLLPGVMGNEVSPVSESFGADRMLEEPHFTRPSEFRGWEVPEILRSGDHAKIERWRRAQALHRTVRARPDLIERRGGLGIPEKRLLEEFPCVPYPEGLL